MGHEGLRRLEPARQHPVFDSSPIEGYEELLGLIKEPAPDL